MQKQTSLYPAYSRSERIADGAMHLLGVMGALIGIILLPIWGESNISSGGFVSLLIYAFSLLATFLASAIYHMTPWEGLRSTFRRFDHAAIYLKIAGTYTPLVVIIGSLVPYVVLAVVWGIAIFGIIQKLFFWQIPGRLGPLLFLVMGWLSIFIIWPLIPIVPTATTWLIVIGGLLYTSGTIFYKWKSLKFSNAIWHGFVVAASTCFYFAIVLAASP